MIELLDLMQSVKKMIHLVEMIEFLDLTELWRRCTRWRWLNFLIWQIVTEDASGEDDQIDLSDRLAKKMHQVWRWLSCFV
jgi:hypothetical protein